MVLHKTCLLSVLKNEVNFKERSGVMYLQYTERLPHMCLYIHVYHQIKRKQSIIESLESCLHPSPLCGEITVRRVRPFRWTVNRFLWERGDIVMRTVCITCISFFRQLQFLPLLSITDLRTYLWISFPTSLPPPPPPPPPSRGNHSKGMPRWDRTCVGLYIFECEGLISCCNHLSVGSHTDAKNRRIDMLPNTAPHCWKFMFKVWKNNCILYCRNCTIWGGKTEKFMMAALCVAKQIQLTEDSQQWLNL
jgi:hypothetical protein